MTPRKFYALPGGWFVVGSVVTLVADCEQGGAIMSGPRLAKHAASELHPVGTVYQDEELCAWEEFEEMTDDAV